MRNRRTWIGSDAAQRQRGRPKLRPGARRAISAVVVLALTFSVMVGLSATPASAQDEDTLDTCGVYGQLVAGGGPDSVALAEELRDLGNPNPPGIDDALDILNDFNDEVGDTPSNDEVEAAFDVLASYYDPICGDIDVCPLVASAVNRNDAESEKNARRARNIFAPNPPGIDAALAVLSGDVSVSEVEFFDTEAEARQAVVDYYSNCQLAYTGATPAPLVILGLTLVAAGGVMLRTQRRAPLARR